MTKEETKDLLQDKIKQLDRSIEVMEETALKSTKHPRFLKIASTLTNMRGRRETQARKLKNLRNGLPILGELDPVYVITINQ